MNYHFCLLIAFPLLFCSCSLADRFGSSSPRHILVSEVWGIKDGKQVVIREYMVEPESYTSKAAQPTKADYDEPGEHVTITRKQLLQAIRSALKKAQLATPQILVAEDEQYRLVSHHLAHKWVMSTPKHHKDEGFDCEDIARRAEDIARVQSSKARKRFAFGLCKGKLRSNKEFHMVNLYFDPIEGACLIDNNGSSMKWSDFSSVELAIIM